VLGDGRGAHAGKGSRSLHELIYEAPSPLVPVLLKPQVERHHHEVVGTEAEGHPPHLAQAVKEEGRAGEHDQGHRDLAHHEEVAQGMPRRADGDVASLLEALAEIEPRGLEGRPEAGGQAGRGRDHDREGVDPPIPGMVGVDGNVARRREPGERLARPVGEDEGEDPGDRSQDRLSITCSRTSCARLAPRAERMTRSFWRTRNGTA
jgi:hypothetical protein